LHALKKQLLKKNKKIDLYTAVQFKSIIAKSLVVIYPTSKKIVAISPTIENAIGCFNLHLIG
jgi:hypothetical protein